MLAKRIIPCLDVKDGVVVKGVNFKNHAVVGNIEELALNYSSADELVFYDIGASTTNSTLDFGWIKTIAKRLRIPFCVAGGIRSVEIARQALYAGADKVSINTPALERPELISDLAIEFGSQAVVVGIDSMKTDDGYIVYSHTGSEKTIRESSRNLKDWLVLAQELGAGEIVLNCMNKDGCRNGYDISQILYAEKYTRVPVIASGGAGRLDDFVELFTKTNSTGALAASVFHNNTLTIAKVREFLSRKGLPVRRLK